MSTDYSFCFPVRKLENGLVKLTPFNIEIHAQTFVDESKVQPEIFTYLPWGPCSTLADLEQRMLEFNIEPDPGSFLYAVYDKPLQAEANLAGTIGYFSTAVSNLWTEIGFIITLPKYQQTHVTTNAVRLMLQYGLDLPKDGGLGLRRVQWQTSANNKRSSETALGAR